MRARRRTPAWLGSLEWADACRRRSQPLLCAWTAPYGLPPFAGLRPAHFEPAFAQVLQAHRDAIDALGSVAAPPDFENTLAAFDRSSRALRRLSMVFHNLCSSETSPELQEAERRLAPVLAAHYSAVYMHAGVFRRIAALHEVRADLGLTPEQLRLLERVHLDFVRTGALLPPAGQARAARIAQELAACHTAFGQNLLHDESHWALQLRQESELAGLPDFVRAAARQAARQRGLGEVHAITLARSSIVPFLTFCERRDLREQAGAPGSRGAHPGEHDNRPLVGRILALRLEEAQLHGYASYAEYALVDRMARTPQAVDRLLDEVWERAKEVMEREREGLESVQRGAGVDHPIEPWDWRYWAEKLRQRDFALDDAEVKPYFSLEAMVAAAFDCAQRLFGLRFTPRADLVLHHPDARGYEVHDREGRAVGLFIHDNFARPSKRSGAWMSSLAIQARNGGELRPVVLNNNNFAQGSPTFLGFDDVRTLFHEFGHGLHGLLSNVTYARLAGTNVLRDFVELPSQLFEHWMAEPEVLRQHARHAKTGEPIPQALVDRLRAAQRFGQAYETVRYCGSAIVDMAVHRHPDPASVADWTEFEAQVLRERGLPWRAPTTGFTHFQHLFSSAGYAAGYYVYLWAQVLDADAWDAFQEAGDPFDPAVAERLRAAYAARRLRGAGAAFRAFRGRDPVITPLLRQKNLLPS